MAKTKRVVAGTSTHFDVLESVDVPGAGSRVRNSQDAQDLLIDPEEGNVSTHSQSDVLHRGKAPRRTTAAVHDEQRTGPQNIHGLDNDEDPAVGYLKQETGLGVAVVPVVASEDDEDDAFTGFDEDEDSEEDNLEASDEDGDEFDNLELPQEVESADLDSEFGDLAAGADEQAEAPSEEFPDLGDDGVTLADADELDDQVDTEELQFATCASTVHVIRANRILASMTKASATKAGVADVYTTDQYADVVTAAIEQRGLRKGLVLSGFQLAKVAIKANKAAEKVVKAKVEAAVSAKVEAMSQQAKAMDQALAIAAVGINRRFFKGANNELKASLETELAQAGVRNGSRLVNAMFAQHGVSYARSILTLATKIAAMPETVRDQYAEALDITDEGDYEEDLEADLDEEEFDEELPEELPASVTAALQHPVRSARLIQAGVKSSAAQAILAGKASLI